MASGPAFYRPQPGGIGAIRYITHAHIWGGAAYAVLGAQRALRILGIFARLCLKGGKAGYLPDPVPEFLDALERRLAAYLGKAQ